MNLLKLLIIFILIIGLFISCEEVTPNLSPEPTPEPTSDPSAFHPTFTEFQGIETNGAYDWECFTIGESHFLVMANYYNGSTHNLNSKIYKWNGFNFSTYQSLGTNGALHWEYFTIEGSHYLAVANYHNDSTYNINSRIYKWNIDTEIFETYQTIGTNGAYDWEYFTIGDDHFLVVANYYNGSTRNINSVVYKWNGVNFVSIQSIGTNGALDWEHFIIDDSHFLAVANYHNNSTYNIDSKIYKWNTSTELFDVYQTKATNGAYAWEYFSINDNHFLAVANNYSGSTYNINSRIYKWNTETELFDLHQPLLTNGANDWKYFIINDTPFLAVANAYNDATYNISSSIYSWSTSQEEFNINQALSTSCARDLEFITIDDNMFLAVANYRNDSTTNINSTIYKITY